MFATFERTLPAGKDAYFTYTSNGEFPDSAIAICFVTVRSLDDLLSLMMPQNRVGIDATQSFQLLQTRHRDRTNRIPYIRIPFSTIIAKSSGGILSKGFGYATDIAVAKWRVFLDLQTSKVGEQ